MNIILFDKMPENNLIPAGDYRAKHINSVLKLREHDTFRMGIINESEGLATVEKINEEGVFFVYEKTSVPVLNPVTLLVAHVRPICMKRILREAVSLGCEKIILTGTDTGEKSYILSSLYTTDEYREYLLDGAMQSAHAGIPKVLFASDVGSAVSLVDPESNLILLDNVHSKGNLSSLDIHGKTVIAVGPERGWSDRERKIFEQNNFIPVLLGQRVLRTETACSAGVAVLLARLGLI